MPFQIIVREIKPLPFAAPRDLSATHASGLMLGSAGAPPGNTIEQIYEQTVESLDLSKVLAAVNFKPRVRKPRSPKTAA